MTNPYLPTGEQRGQLDYSLYEDEAGYGLVTFAGVMLAIVGTINVLYGIAAIDDATVFVKDARFVVGDLATWGWFLTALGILQWFAAFGVWRGAGWARWFGVGCASVNLVLQIVWIAAFPVVAMTILALDLTVIYALLVYGGRRAAARAAREREKSAG